MPHLVRVRLDDGKRVRQTARRSELPPEALRLIGALTEARLLTTRTGEAGQEREPLVEVTHESLFKAWPTLDQWLTEEQAFLTDLERIRAAQENYAKAPDEQKSGELLYGLLLSRARDWLLKYPQRFVSRDMEPLRAFIAASAEVADAERARAQRVRRAAFVGMAVATAAICSALEPFRAKRQLLNGRLVRQTAGAQTSPELRQMPKNRRAVRHRISLSILSLSHYRGRAAVRRSDWPYRSIFAATSYSRRRHSRSSPRDESIPQQSDYRCRFPYAATRL